MTTLGDGFKVGHYTDPQERSGCTVVIQPTPNVTSCDIRGSSPGSRELAILDPSCRIEEVNAILLTGGSAFGLAAADGVVGWLEERGIGHETSSARVPIVPAAVIYDLRSADAGARPRSEHGRAACEAAVEGEVAVGRVGAGTGATAGKWDGFENAVPGGLGAGSATHDEMTVNALAVVNAVGHVVDADGTLLTGPEAGTSGTERGLPDGNTVLTVVTVKANLTKSQVQWLAARGTDGVTRSLRPAHTPFDGDVTFACATPGNDVDESSLMMLGYLATEAVVAAITNAIEASRSN